MLLLCVREQPLLEYCYQIDIGFILFQTKPYSIECVIIRQILLNYMVEWMRKSSLFASVIFL